jgi:hypothetical protein
MKKVIAAITIAMIFCHCGKQSTAKDEWADARRDTITALQVETAFPTFDTTGNYISRYHFTTTRKKFHYDIWMNVTYFMTLDSTSGRGLATIGCQLPDTARIVFKDALGMGEYISNLETNSLANLPFLTLKDDKDKVLLIVDPSLRIYWQHSTGKIIPSDSAAKILLYLLKKPNPHKYSWLEL